MIKTLKLTYCIFICHDMAVEKRGEMCGCQKVEYIFLIEF